MGDGRHETTLVLGHVVVKDMDQIPAVVRGLFGGQFDRPGHCQARAIPGGSHGFAGIGARGIDHNDVRPVLRGRQDKPALEADEAPAGGGHEPRPGGRRFLPALRQRLLSRERGRRRALFRNHQQANQGKPSHTEFLPGKHLGANANPHAARTKVPMGRAPAGGL